MSHLVIVGGSDAGVSAALRAREMDPTAEVTVVVQDDFPNYSVCGLPFYLSGEVLDWHRLAHRTEAEIRAAGVHLLLGHRAQALDPMKHTVSVVDQQERHSLLSYDRLVLATGAVPIHPPVSGLDLPGVFLLRSMDDGLHLGRQMAASSPGHAVILGGGYLGVEMADALVHRGYAVTLVEHHPSVLKSVDASLSQMVQAELRRQGVEVVTGVAVEHICEQAGHLHLSGGHGFAQSADLVLVTTGVRPASELAQAAGAEVGERGAIRVTARMETTLPDIFAAGDCVETSHRLLAAPTYLPLGTTAHKQGRVAGENAVGGQRRYAGSLGTQVVKVFDLAVARTGLSETEAQAAGFAPLTIQSSQWDHTRYYPGAKRLAFRLTGDRKTGKLLGAQIVGDVGAQVAKRIDSLATSLFHGMRVKDLEDLDLSYTPPLGSPWDAIQLAAQTWVKHAQEIGSAASSSGGT